MPDLLVDQQPKLWAVLFSNDLEKRMASLEILTKVDADWPVPWLALLTADSYPRLANEAYKALRRRGRNVLSLLTIQRLSPLAKVRQAVVKLVGEIAGIDHVYDVLPALFDPDVDVREEGRRSLEAMLHRTIEGVRKSEGAPEELEQAMRLFAEMCNVPQINVRTIMVSCFMRLALENKPLFWELFPGMDSHSRTAIEHEIMAHPNFRRIELLYCGMLLPDERLRDRAVNMIARVLNKDTISSHVQSLVELPPQQINQALKILSDSGHLSTFFEYFGWIQKGLRIRFVRLFQGEIGRGYLTFLLHMLNDGDPALVAVIMECFLSMEIDLPFEMIQRMLYHPNRIIRQSIIHYLYFRGNSNIVPRLLQMIGTEDPETATLAARTISRISRDYLIDHFNEMGETERNQLTLVLRRVDPNFVQSIIEVLGGLNDQDRIHLTRILTAVAEDETAQSVLKDLTEDPSDRLRATAVRAIQKDNAAQWEDDDILRLFNDEDGRVRANLIESLPLERKKDWEERILESTHSDIPRERGNAVFALYEIGNKEFEFPLMQMLQHPDSWMRASGLWVLSQVKAPHLLDKALELCRDRAPHVRVHAIRAIGKQGNADLARQITPFLNDPIADVREAAHAAIKTQMGLDYRG